MALGFRARGEGSGGGAGGGGVQEREGGDGGGLWCGVAVVMRGVVMRWCVFFHACGDVGGGGEF